MLHTRETLIWESYDGRKTLVKDLDVRHLVNILNHVRESNLEAQSDVYPTQVCQMLEAEGELRIMAGWTKNIGIPRRIEDGTWELINLTANEKAVEDAKTARYRAELKKPKNQRLGDLELIVEMHKIQQLTTPEICK